MKVSFPLELLRCCRCQELRIKSALPGVMSAVTMQMCFFLFNKCASLGMAISSASRSMMVFHVCVFFAGGELLSFIINKLSLVTVCSLATSSSFKELPTTTTSKSLVHRTTCYNVLVVCQTSRSNLSYSTLLSACYLIPNGPLSRFESVLDCLPKKRGDSAK